MFNIQANTDITKIDPNEPEFQLFKAFIPLHTITDWRYADEVLRFRLETSTDWVIAFFPDINARAGSPFDPL